MITALSGMYFDPDTFKKVEHFERLSIFEKGHSHSPDFQEKPLDCVFLEGELQAFKELIKKYNKAADSFRKEMSNKKKNVFTSCVYCETLYFQRNFLTF